MKVLIPVDDQYFGAEQAAFVADHNWPEGTEFHVVNVLYSIILERSMVSSQMYLDQVMKEARQHAHAVVDNVKELLESRMPGATVTAEVKEGKAAEKILELAREWPADWIVLLSHGREGIGQLFLGSVSQSVLAHSPCRVLVVGMPKGMPHRAEKKNAAVEIKIK